MEWEPDPRILNLIFVLIAGFVPSNSAGPTVSINVWDCEPAARCLFDVFYNAGKFPVYPKRTSLAKLYGRV